MFFRKVRPRFRLRVPFDPDSVVARIITRVERPDSSCIAMVAGAHSLVELRVNERESRFWSPALSISVSEPEGAGGSLVHILVGPNPNVWTLFAMLYMGLWTMIMFAGVFGLVQWSLGQPPWGLWVTAVLGVTLVVLYGVSRIGQRLAAPQTATLRRVVEEALDVPSSAREVTDRDPYREPRAGS